MKLDINDIRSHPYPRIEIRNGVPILLIDQNVLMRLPPLDEPIAQAAFAARLPPEQYLQLAIARFKRITFYAPDDIIELMEALERVADATGTSNG